MTSARDDLLQAQSLGATVCNAFLSAGCIAGAKLLNDVIGLLTDAIAALDKAIADGKP